MNAFLLALQFSTRIPLRRDLNDADQATVYLPLIGLIVGLISAFVTWFGVGFFTLGPGVLLGMLVAVLLGGSLPYGTQGHRPFGTGGATATFFSLGLRFTAIAAIATVDLERACQWIVAGAVMGKWASLGLMRFFPGAPDAQPGLDRLSDEVTPGRWWTASAYSLFLVVGFAGLPGLLPVLVAGMVITAIGGWYGRLRLRGVTGDCLVAVQHLVEIATLLVGIRVVVG